MLLHGRQPAISLLCCSSTCSIASPWLRYLFIAPLLPCLLCCFSGSSDILCLLLPVSIESIAPPPALRSSACFALLRLHCASLPTLLTSACSVAPLSVQAACSVALLRGTDRIPLASITFLMNIVLHICSPSIM